MSSPLHRDAPHESAARHVTGEARYVDDIAGPAGTLFAMVLASPHARARVLRRDAGAARKLPGVRAVLFAEHVPGANRIGPIFHDEPLLAEDEVHYHGQAVALVVGETREACRRALAAVEVDYEPLEPILSIDAAIAAGAFLTAPHVIARGDVGAALAEAPVLIEAEVRSGGQDHFYLETHAALAIPEEGGGLRILSSTQHPTEVQRATAHVLGISEALITCEVPRMGGGFGGKESQATNWAAFAALAARHTGRAARTWLDRDEDMRFTGKRHPFSSRYRAGFDEQGRILGFEVYIFSDGGWVVDLSGPVMDRALFHLDNAYFIPALRFEGRVCRTNLPSNTAFRGFGGPQGMVVVEDAMQRFAERQGVDATAVRRLNYYGEAPRDRAPYGQRVPIEGNRLARVHDELLAEADYAARRAAVAAFNAGSPYLKRGLAFQPIKFGISFTKALLNQAGALVLIYADGTVQLNHGGTEMGQGLHTKMLTVAAHELGVPVSSVRIMNTSTEKVPNTSATAASSGSDLNGAAVREACVTLRERLRPVAAELLGCAPDAVRFEDGEARSGKAAVPFAKVTTEAWVRQIGLSATGFYATPGIAYDERAGQGTPFYYYAYGGALSEVELNGLTGESRVLRVDILHDVGDALVPSIDIGQVEGAFVQGLGWLTTESVLFDASGRLLTHGPSTYKIPAVGDVPLDFRVSLLCDAANPQVVGGSKAVGEPPFMLAISVHCALRDAVRAFRGGGEVDLAMPATGEALLEAIG